MNNNKQIIEQLNDLMVINYDAKNGYLNAKENTDNADLKRFFSTKFKQRSQFIFELYDEIKSLGGTPVSGGSVVGQMHRSWMDLKSLITGKDEEAILDACETGEEAALKNYEIYMESPDIPMNIKTLLSKQRNLIASSLRSIDHLEEVFETC